MRVMTVILAVILACGPAQIEPNGDPILRAASTRPEIRGTRLVAPSSDRPHQTLDVAVTSPVMPGDTATATVGAAAGSRCAIEVTYRSGVSEAQGLAPVTAGEDGAVSWTWIVGINTTPGDWVVAVECAPPDGPTARGHARLSVAPMD
jgi:hypothetical protein